MKRIIAMLTSLILILAALAACGQGNNAQKAGDASQPSTQSPAKSAEKSSSGDFFPLDEEVTLTAFVLGMEGGVDYTDNYVTEWIKEKTNINLKFTTAVSGDDGKTKLNLMLYSKETLPDVFIATGWTKAECALYGAEGIVIPLNKYLENAKRWKELTELCPAYKGDVTMLDGNIYTYGDVNECFHCTHQARMWIYQPWVDSLNGGVLPGTTDELYDFLVKVKTMDPNGNGVADEIPMTGFLGGWASDPFTFLSNAFVQNNNIMSNTNPTIAAGLVIDKSGKLRYNLISNEYRDALTYMNRLYSEGLLDPQTYTQTSDQANATLENDIHLVALMGGGAMPQNADFWPQREGLWQKWTILPPLKGPKGVQLGYTSLNGYFGSCIGLVSADCKNPEIAVQMYDTLASLEGNTVTGLGVEGITWEWTNTGTNLVGGTPIYRKLSPEHRLENGNVDWAAYGYSFKDATWDSDARIGSSTNEYREAEAVDNPDLNVEAVLFRSANVYNKYAFDPDSIVPDMPYTAEQSKLISEYAVSVGAYANSASIRFITGDMNIQTGWDAYLSEMDKMGVNNYISVMQEAYDTYKNSLGK